MLLKTLVIVMMIMILGGIALLAVCLSARAEADQKHDDLGLLLRAMHD